jgi:hypothetical protein
MFLGCAGRLHGRCSVSLLQLLARLQERGYGMFWGVLAGCMGGVLLLACCCFHFCRSKVMACLAVC